MKHFQNLPANRIEKPTWPGLRTALLAAGALASLSAALLSGPSRAVAQVAASGQSAAITLEGAGPFHRLTVPIGVYNAAASTDLRELRVRNAQGNAVPFAWVQSESVAPPPPVVSTAARVFPVPLSPGKEPSAALQLRRQSDGSLVLASKTPVIAGNADWIADASAVRGTMVQARMSLAAGTQGVFEFRVDASDDLKQWREVSAKEQVLVLNHSGANLEQLSFELYNARGAYLRLRWLDAGGVSRPTITALQIDAIQGAPPTPRTQWTAPIAPSTCDATSCDYALPALLPLDLVRLDLSESNSLASIELLGINPVSAPAATPARHRHRNPLHVLRGRKYADASPVSTNGETQSLLANTVVYRLAQGAGQQQVQVRSPDIHLSGNNYTTLRLRVKGSMALLGAKPPDIVLGSTPRSLVFLARGNAPFSLTWGAPLADGADATQMALSALVPGDAGRGLEAAPDTAQVDAARIGASVPKPAAKAVAVAVATPAPKDPTHKFWLWGALAGAVALLGAMAFSLLRSMKKASPPA